MRLQKRGRFRNDGTTVIANGGMEPCRSITADKGEYMYLRCEGADNGNKYYFYLELSDEELMAAVRFRLGMAASSKAEAAVGAGACATIESLLTTSMASDA